MFLSFFLKTALSGTIVADVKGFKITCTILSDTEIAIGDGNKNAFVEYIKPITNFTLPETALYNNKEYKIAEVSSYAFTESPFNKIVFPASVRKIGSYCFFGSERLEILSISKCKITELPPYIFADCPLLETILCSKQVHEIGEGAFTNTGITFIHVQSHFQVVNPKAFSGAKLTEVDLSTCSLTSLSESMFENCSDLTDIIFPNSLESISPYAFARCGLKKLTLPSSLKSIGHHAFHSCEYLDFIDISNCNLQKIEPYLFSLCTYLQSAVLPEKIVEIGAFSFANTSLSYFKPNENLQIIRERCFLGCRKLSVVDLSDSLCHTIESYAFADCSSLETFQMSTTLVNIEDYAFMSTKLTKFSSVIVQFLGKGVFSSIRTLKSIDLSMTHLTVIPEFLFKDSYSLHSILLPESLRTIKDGAFSGTKITEIHIPSSVYKVGPKLFESCVNLEKLDLGFTNITEIPDNFLGECSRLTKIILPPFVESISQSAFIMCSQLKEIYYLGHKLLPEGILFPPNSNIYVSQKYKSKKYGIKDIHVTTDMNNYIPVSNEAFNPEKQISTSKISNSTMRSRKILWIWILAAVFISYFVYTHFLAKSVFIRRNLLNPARKTLENQGLYAKPDQYIL